MRDFITIVFIVLCTLVLWFKPAIAPIEQSYMDVVHVHNTTEIYYENKSVYNFTSYTYEKGWIQFAYREPRYCGPRATEFVVHGQSMHPLFAEQERIMIEPVRFRQLDLGDVVVFTDPNTQGKTIHAIVYLDSMRQIAHTAGYANHVRDNFTLTPGMILGRYCTLV